MWLTSGRTSGRKKTLLQYSSLTLLIKDCYEEEVQPHWKTDYKPMIYIYIYSIFTQTCVFPLYHSHMSHVIGLFLLKLQPVQPSYFSYFFYLPIFPTFCRLIFVTFTLSVMVSNFDIGWQQVPCYLSEFMAFKCYVCHIFSPSIHEWICLLNTGLSPPEPIAERRTSYPCTTRPTVWTCSHNNDEIAQSCCWREDWTIPAVSGCKHHGQ